MHVKLQTDDDHIPLGSLLSNVAVHYSYCVWALNLPWLYRYLDYKRVNVLQKYKLNVFQL